MWSVSAKWCRYCTFRFVFMLECHTKLVRLYTKRFLRLCITPMIRTKNQSKAAVSESCNHPPRLYSSCNRLRSKTKPYDTPLDFRVDDLGPRWRALETSKLGLKRKKKYRFTLPNLMEEYLLFGFLADCVVARSRRLISTLITRLVPKKNIFLLIL